MYVCVSFDERIQKLAAFLEVETFGRLGVEGSKFIDQLAASVVGGRDGVGPWEGKRSNETTSSKIVSVTSSQAAISRRVSRFKPQLRDRQEAIRSSGGGMTDPHRPCGKGAWMRPMRFENRTQGVQSEMEEGAKTTNGVSEIHHGRK